MAARTRKARKFYVYRLFDEFGDTKYVGKGSGRRLAQQIARFKLAGEILEDFCLESAAYRCECRYIAKLRPPLNQNKGGAGPIGSRKAEMQPAWVREIETVGSRRYAARVLLRFDLSGHIDPSKLDMLRRVANGPWC